MIWLGFYQAWFHMKTYNDFRFTTLRLCRRTQRRPAPSSWEPGPAPHTRSASIQRYVLTVICVFSSWNIRPLSTMIQSTHSYHVWVRNIIPNDYSFCYIMHSHSLQCNLLYFEIICCLNFSNSVVIFAPSSLKCQNHTVTPIQIIEYYLMKIFAESFFF